MSNLYIYIIGFVLKEEWDRHWSLVRQEKSGEEQGDQGVGQACGRDVQPIGFGFW